jgi:hypothetical protein
MTMTEIEPLTIGATLKKRREELGLTLSGIAEKTCIRCTFLQAMEADRFDGFPGDAYLQGFLKLFAEALGLDSSVVIDQFRAQTGIPAGGRKLNSAGYALPIVAPRCHRRFSGTISRIIVLGGLAFAAVYLILHYGPFSTDSKLTDSPPLSSGSAEFSLSAGRVVPLLLVDAQAERPGPDNSMATTDLAGPAEAPGSEYLLPVGGAMLRVEALGAVLVETLIDDHPVKVYALAKDSVLSWRVLNSLELQVDAPELLKVWLGNEPLELQGRSQLSLQAATSVVNVEGR